jgi:hypothetical protein
MGRAIAEKGEGKFERDKRDLSLVVASLANSRVKHATG